MSEIKKKFGVHYLFKGFDLLRNHKELWKYCIIPVLFTTALFVPAIIYAPDFFSWLTELLQLDILSSESLLEYFNSDANVLLRWLAIIFGGLLLIIYTLFVWVIVFAAILMLLVLLFVLVLKIIAAPFNDKLSELIEHIHDNSVEETPIDFWASIKVAVITESQRLLIFLAVAVPLYLFAWFLPGLGHAIVALILVVYSCFWYTYDAMSYSMDRYGWGLKRRIKFLTSNWWPAMGFGLGIYVIALIPILNLFIMPLFVAGGTLLYIDLHLDPSLPKETAEPDSPTAALEPADVPEKLDSPLNENPPSEEDKPVE